MAENKVTGRVIAVSKEQTVVSSDATKAPFKKREIYIDCTRYDPYTGDRSEYENKPLLEFVGEKLLAKVNPVLDQVQKDDIVAISFELQGRPYKTADGKTKVMTGVRCYAIEIVRRAGQPVQQAAPQPAPAPAAPTANPNPNPFPPMGNDQQQEPLPF